MYHECEQQLINAIDANIAKCRDDGNKQQLKILTKFKRSITKLWQKELNLQ